MSGALGSIVSTGWSSAFGNGAGGMIAFGALSGGIGAELTGGNFWQGAITGGIVAGLNHSMHKFDSPTESNNTTEKGKGDVGSNDNTGLTTGEIIFEDLTKKQLQDFRVIPENGKPFTPANNGTYEGDGFYYKNFSDKRYWYKVSAGGSVTITYSNNRYHFAGVTNLIMQFYQEARGKYYKVGWEPKSKPHWTQNPFDLNKK